MAVASDDRGGPPSRPLRFNLAASRPDLLTGVDPATGQPQPYGSVGIDINCAVIGFTASAPNRELSRVGEPPASKPR